VRDMLWDIALTIEDGGLSMAARNLRDALDKLSEALNDKKTPEAELQQLAENVQRRMMEYMQAMANEMQQRMADGKKIPEIPPELAQKFMQHMDMEKLMQAMKDMQQGSSREQMQKMAEFFKNALDNVDMSKLQEMQEGQQRAMEALQDMQKLIDRQQKLLDQTGKKEQGEDTAGEAKEQQAIRNDLGEVMRKLGEGMPQIPENFGKADQQMKDALKSLSEGNGQASIPAQREALKQLQAAQDNAIQQMAQGMQQMILSFGAMPKQERYGEGFDPLGREDGNGKATTGDIVIPEEAERRRVQEIIRELRDRSNDYQRPKAEREYIDRLLDMFYEA
jgi:tetratricopeptide (TPR) repeat protein